MRDYLTKLLSPLAEKLSCDIYIFSDNGECIYPAEPHNPPPILKPAPDVTATAAGFTFFTFKAASHTLIGAVSGTGNDTERIAIVIAALLEKRVSPSDLSREEKFRAIVLGETDLSLLYEMKSKFSKACYNVFAITFNRKDYKPVYEFLSQLCLDDDVAVGVDEKTICLLKKLDDTDDYQSANEFAQLLNESMAQELGKPIMIGIGGTAKSVSDIAGVYSQAVSAFRLGKLLDSTSNIFSYKELIILKMIEDIPRDTLKGYLNILADKPTLEILADEEMMNTAKELLSNSLNISETSRLMYMHRNTLIYRLDKIEKATGLNIRNFSDAVTFRMIITLYKLLNTK